MDLQERVAKVIDPGSWSWEPKPDDKSIEAALTRAGRRIAMKRAAEIIQMVRADSAA